MESKVPGHIQFSCLTCEGIDHCIDFVNHANVGKTITTSSCVHAQVIKSSYDQGEEDGLVVLESSLQ